MKIYTRTGDKGQTGLLGGLRIAKNSHRIQAIGEVDELNAWLGFIRTWNAEQELETILHQLQQDLFCLGAQLAATSTISKKIPEIKAKDITRLEQWIDTLDATLKPLQHFILPGGSQTAAALHIGRSVCRRAERSLTALQEHENISEHLLMFLNRLSDLLFVMARFSNAKHQVEEEKWQPEKITKTIA